MAQKGTGNESKPGDPCSFSRNLYLIMEYENGSSNEVSLRRQKYDTINAINSNDREGHYAQLIRGSRAEGFSNETSDIDVMFVDRHTVVLSANSVHKFLKDFEKYSIFTYIDSSPGFVLLVCLKVVEPNNQLFQSLTESNGRLLLSSKLFKENIYRAFNNADIHIHGPCMSGSYTQIEFDIGYCLQCEFWPEQAMSFIHRAEEASWPSRNVLIDICGDGCLLVPINSKEKVHVKDISDLEWRFSFSMSENKIVQSMNHCQFLCYALLKSFLNEILRKNPNTESLLCSYHMKTAIFWEICGDPRNWDIDSFVLKFWQVFRRLMSWVADGYCPHFFIPERNMFIGRVYGRNKAVLDEFLRSLYHERNLCFLRCLSLEKSLLCLMHGPEYCNYRRDIIYMHLQILSCFQKAKPRNLSDAYMAIKSALKFRDSRPDLQHVAEFRLNDVLQSFAELCLCVPMSNQLSYSNERFSLNILSRSRTFRFRNDIIMIKHIFKSKNYYKTIQLATELKSEFNFLTYIWDTTFPYSNALKDFPMEGILRRFVSSFVSINEMTAIDDLKIECKAKSNDSINKELRIPPLVFLDFLLVLSYNAISDVHNRNKELDELYALVHNEGTHHIHMFFRAISWEILGICQQICGDTEGAVVSFSNAFQDKYNDFKHATMRRQFSLREHLDLEILSLITKIESLHS